MKYSIVKNLLNSILYDKSNNFFKKLVTLIVTLHFLLASFLILILFPILFFRVTKGNLDMVKVITATFMDILDKDFWIILAGLGFLTTKDFATAMIEKAKAIAGGLPSNIVNQDGGTILNTTTDNLQTDKVDTVNSQNTVINSSNEKE